MRQTHPILETAFRNDKDVHLIYLHNLYIHAVLLQQSCFLSALT